MDKVKICLGLLCFYGAQIILAYFCFAFLMFFVFRGRCSTLWALKCKLCGRCAILCGPWSVDFVVRAQYFVDLEVQISWQAQYFVDLEVQILWQVRSNLWALKCKFCGRCSTLWALKCKFCNRRSTLWTLKAKSHRSQKSRKPKANRS